MAARLHRSGIPVHAGASRPARAPEEHHDQAHTITGPEPVPIASVAQELTARPGHRIRAEDPAPQETFHGFDPCTRQGRARTAVVTGACAAGRGGR
ncbi:hypothetical protein [Streptosporangium sandarakinum]|uniref:hypothetical protein n=1 Tax=Streptosporangium sandarakinum TaxID=1260955 RepID=UPI003435A3E8